MLSSEFNFRSSGERKSSLSLRKLKLHLFASTLPQIDIVAEIAKSILLLGLRRKKFYLEKPMRYLEDVFTQMCGLFLKWNSKNRKNLSAEEKKILKKR